MGTFRVRFVAEFKRAQPALQNMAQRLRLAAGAPQIMQPRGEQHDAERKPGVNEKQFVEFEAEHVGSARCVGECVVAPVKRDRSPLETLLRWSEANRADESGGLGIEPGIAAVLIEKRESRIALG